MAIQIAGTRTVLQTAYTGNATWIGAATGAPGTSTTPSNECTGGTPTYARKQTTWTGGSGSAVTLDILSSTVTFIILATAATLATTNMADNCSCTSTTITGQGTLVVTPSISIS